MSLRDQLQKSGLLSKEKLKRAERAVHKTQHKKDLEIRSKKSDEHFLQTELALAEERARDQISFEQEQKLRDEEVTLNHALTLIRKGELNDTKADGSYYFSLPDGQIDKLNINELQKMQLAAGQLAIAVLESEKRYVIVSEDTAEKILKLHPEFIVCFHKATSRLP